MTNLNDKICSFFIADKNIKMIINIEKHFTNGQTTGYTTYLGKHLKQLNKSLKFVNIARLIKTRKGYVFFFTRITLFISCEL